MTAPSPTRAVMARPYRPAAGRAPPIPSWCAIPETGRKSLFVNRGFTTRINDLTREEGNAVLEMLWRHIETHVEFQCRVRWTPNTLVFWDNRCTQHHAVWDYYPHSRYGQRVSIVGERPVA